MTQEDVAGELGLLQTKASDLNTVLEQKSSRLASARSHLATSAVRIKHLVLSWRILSRLLVILVILAGLIASVIWWHVSPNPSKQADLAAALASGLMLSLVAAVLEALFTKNADRRQTSADSDVALGRVPGSGPSQDEDAQKALESEQAKATAHLEGEDTKTTPDETAADEFPRPPVANFGLEMVEIWRRPESPNRLEPADFVIKKGQSALGLEQLRDDGRYGFVSSEVPRLDPEWSPIDLAGRTFKVVYDTAMPDTSRVDATQVRLRVLNEDDRYFQFVTVPVPGPELRRFIESDPAVTEGMMWRAVARAALPLIRSAIVRHEIPLAKPTLAYEVMINAPAAFHAAARSPTGEILSGDLVGRLVIAMPIAFHTISSQDSVTLTLLLPPEAILDLAIPVSDVFCEVTAPDGSRKIDVHRSVSGGGNAPVNLTSEFPNSFGEATLEAPGLYRVQWCVPAPFAKWEGDARVPVASRVLARDSFHRTADGRLVTVPT